jgi:glycopeptide antibiotics resistance protein
MDHDITSKINPKILGAALLFYILIVTLIFTLVPFNYNFSNLNRIAGIFDMQLIDSIKNVILFIPTGFLLASIFTDRKKYIKSFLFGLFFSSIIELNQIFLPSRNPGFNDILTNSLGSLIGCFSYDYIKHNIQKRSAILVHLSIPIMNIVFMLIPALWLSSFAAGYDVNRLWLLFLLGTIGAILVSEVYVNRFNKNRMIYMMYFGVLLVGWYLVGVFPSLIKYPKHQLAITLSLAVFSLIRMSFGTKFKNDKRFELRILKKVIPVFAFYILILSQLPIKFPTTNFHFFLFPKLHLDQQYFLEIYRFLEYFAAFAIVGYLISEYINRSKRPGNKTLRVIAWILAISVFLEILRGFHPMHAATVTHFIIAFLWGIFGALIYIMQLYYFRMIVDNEKHR